MFLRELHNNIVDTAVIFHDELNPKLFDNNEMLPEVRYKLLQIAKNFIKFIDIPTINLRDITISGSNAAFTYTDNSDIDLHLIVETSDKDEKNFKQLFLAKKNQYNFDHNIKIRGIDVEVYVQDVKDEHHSAGIYSVLDNQWLSEPSQVKVSIDDQDVQNKVENYLSKIQLALKSDDLTIVKTIKERLHSLRKTGLEREGEFSVENIAYKVLRNKGFIDKLHKHIYNIEDRNLSLENFYGSRF